MREQEAVYLVGLVLMLVSYALVARWCLPQLVRTRIRPKSVVAFYFGTVAFTQVVPILAIVYPRSSGVDRLGALVEILAATAWTIYLARRIAARTG